MHISNKYVPFGRGKKDWECWLISPRRIQEDYAHYIRQYDAYGWDIHLKRAEEVLTSRRRYETNTWYFGAHQKASGAWSSGVRLRDAKREANKIHRRREKELIHDYFARGDFDDDIESFCVSTGRWD